MWSVRLLFLSSDYGADALCHRYAHRLRKEGHTKLMEYSLVPKQATFHKLSGIRRRNVLRVQANASRSADAMEVDEEEEDVSEKEESGDEENVAPKKSSGKGKERAIESDDESEEEEEAMEVDDEESAGEGTGPTPKRKQKERIISADEVRAHLRLLFATETDIIPLLYAPHGPLATAKISGPSTSSRPTASADIFFMEVISVPPTRFRPAATMGDQVFENPQNSLLNAILRQTFTIRDLNRDLAAAQNVVVEINPQGVVTGKPPIDKTRLYTMLLESLVGLQIAVNSHIDSGKNPTIMRGGKLPPMGVKQMLEKKEGLFRMNMMVSLAPSSTWTPADPVGDRGNVSTTPHDQSFRPTSTSKRTKSEFHQSSLERLPSRNPSRSTTSPSFDKPSSTVRRSILEHASCKWRMDI